MWSEWSTFDHLKLLGKEKRDETDDRNPEMRFRIGKIRPQKSPSYFSFLDLTRSGWFPRNFVGNIRRFCATKPSNYFSALREESVAVWYTMELCWKIMKSHKIIFYIILPNHIKSYFIQLVPLGLYIVCDGWYVVLTYRRSCHFRPCKVMGTTKTTPLSWEFSTGQKNFPQNV